MANHAVVLIGLIVVLLQWTMSQSTLDERISHSYYFESHGRDDLREWRAAILKGAQYIKIDFNFITDPALCQQQQLLPPSYNFTMGCFLLVHSFRNTTFWNTPALSFNTTLDIASWLLDDANLDVMMLRPIVFQVCFKGKPNLCDGSSLAAQWVTLMDAFYALVQPIISDPSRIKGNIQFVFDQLNQADQCILERWRPWNSTWVGEAGTGEDNNDGGNATFQMVNMEMSWTTDWQHLNNTNMGKFHNGAYAMVAWEPVDEVQCTGFFKYFRTFRYANPAGTILAYNADPSMFHVFTSSETGRYSHFPYGPEQALTPVIWYSDAKSQLFTVSLISTDAAALIVSFHRRGPRGAFTLVSTVPVLLEAGDAWTVFGSCLSTLGGSALNTTAVALFVAGCNGALVPLVVDFGPVTYTIDATAAAIPTAASSGGQSVGVGFAAASPGVVIAAVAVVDVLHSLHTSIVVVHVNGSTSFIHDEIVASEVSVLDGVNAAITWDSSSQWVGIVVSWSSNRYVYASAMTGKFSLSDSTFTTTSLQPPLNASRHVKVGVGKNPYLSFAPTAAGSSDGNTRLLLSYGWSFCYNDEYVDDDAFTMQSVKICDLRDFWYTDLFANHSNPVNSYVFSSFNAFANEIAMYGGSDGAPAQHLNGFATSCSDSIYHGVYDIGYNASVVLIPRGDADVDINLGGYLGVSALTSLTWPWVSVSFCGNPVPHNGRVVLDTFPLFGFYNQSAL